MPRQKKIVNLPENLESDITLNTVNEEPKAEDNL
jgi:hypothetical protein